MGGFFAGSGKNSGKTLLEHNTTELFSAITSLKKQKSRDSITNHSFYSGGEKGIRTLAQLALATAFRVRTLRPLGYLSICVDIIAKRVTKIKS